jgi:membrane protein DedA with SNARE-associated domain
MTAFAPLPNEPTRGSVFSPADLHHLFQTYGYGVIGGIVALEGMGIPLPGETVLIIAALYAGRTHELHILPVVAAAALGAIAGDNAGFFIGRELGYRLLLRYGSYIGLNEKRIKLGQYLFRRHGGKVVFVARFIAVLRTVAALLAGMNHMVWRRFVVFNAAGGILWASLYGSGAYLLGREIEHVARPIGIALGVLGAIAIIAALMFLRRHEAQLQAEAELAIPGPLRGQASAQMNPPRA